MKRFWFAALLCCMLFFTASAGAEAFTAVVPVRGAEVEIHTTLIANEEAETEDAWLFLPAFADLSSLVIRDSDLTWNLTPDENEEGVWLYEGMRGEATEARIHVMQSAHLRAMFLFSDDPETKGREYIESDTSHQLETTGLIALVDTEGQVDYAGRLRQLRGRGNTSWWNVTKKSYKIKLEDKYDLLETGDPQEHNRTWWLIGNGFDSSLLHNQIAMDLALELGLSSTSRSEQVDLYYDGEYLGPYLLTEKSEVSNGRIDGLSYGELLEKWNGWAGQNDLDALPVASGVNRFGDTYYYVDGLLDNGTVNAGTYLVQMTSTSQSKTQTSGFDLDQRWYVLKDPVHASENMMRYASERLSEALTALRHGGVHPETGKRAEDLLDVDGFARMLLVFELGYNQDGFLYASTNFVLPEGGGLIQPGPVWDFDDALRYRYGALDAGYGQGLKPAYEYEFRNLMRDFYQTPVFAEAIKEICINEFYPIVRDVLLGDKPGKYLKSMDEYVDQLRASARMNDRLGTDRPKNRDLLHHTTFEHEAERLRQFLQQRSEWMHQIMGLRGGTGADQISVTMQAEWLYPEEALHFDVAPWSRVSVQEFSHEQVTEATEEDYALWQADVVFAPDKGYAFTDPSVLINNACLDGELQEDGTLHVSFLFEDRSYRPVDYYGEDIGLIFNPEYYAFNHPEALDACGGDEELLMDYFCDEGMYVGHRGNGFFDSKVIALHMPHVARDHGDDLPSIYWDFISFGFEYEFWFESVDALYAPPVHPISQ